MRSGARAEDKLINTSFIVARKRRKEYVDANAEALREFEILFLGFFLYSIRKDNVFRIRGGLMGLDALEQEEFK